MEYKTGEAAKFTGVDSRRIAQYLHKGQVVPSTQSAGQGRAAKLSILDVLKVDIVARLSDAGMSARAAGRIAAKAVRMAGTEDMFTWELDQGMHLTINLEECRKRIFPDIDKDEFRFLAVKKELLK